MKDEKRTIILMGIGMGTTDTLTKEALSQLEACDCIIGARRMLSGLSHMGKPVYPAYQADDVKRIIADHQEYQKIVIACSGDIGFYSGAKELREALAVIGEVKMIPGISSVVYLAARLGVSWEDAKLISVHGRKQHYIHVIARNKKTFLLFGGSGCGDEFCRKIKDYRMDEVKFWIGTSLSYEEERIICKTGAEIKPEDLQGLTVLYVENDRPLTDTYGSIADGCFIRGKVPMTKEEVRTISISKLGLTQESVLYDVGAGTGSVAVQAASYIEGLTVYAVDKNPEAIHLIRQNQRKFYADQVIPVQGTAPAVFGELEPPTHVFIGGSSGNLKTILRCVREKNPQVCVVLNAISLETLNDVLEAQREGLLDDIEIVQITAAKSKTVAGYHMMNGENPIYIISERKQGDET